MGLYLGAVVELGGGLRGAIFCHALNNVLAVVGPRVGVELAPGGATLSSAGLLAAGAGLLLFAVRPRPRPRPPLSPGPRGNPGDPTPN